MLVMWKPYILFKEVLASLYTQGTTLKPRLGSPSGLEDGLSMDHIVVMS